MKSTNILILSFYIVENKIDTLLQYKYNFLTPRGLHNDNEKSGDSSYSDSSGGAGLQADLKTWHECPYNNCNNGF